MPPVVENIQYLTRKAHLMINNSKLYSTTKLNTYVKKCAETGKKEKKREYCVANYL